MKNNGLNRFNLVRLSYIFTLFVLNLVGILAELPAQAQVILGVGKTLCLQLPLAEQGHDKRRKEGALKVPALGQILQVMNFSLSEIQPHEIEFLISHRDVHGPSPFQFVPIGK